MDDRLLLLIVLVPSIILHEISHGWVALAFGDPTAKEAKRLSLNPIRHIDPFGTVILPAILVFVGSAPFGWAKPVPVDPRRMRDPRNHSLLVSLAGPATNLVLVLLATLAFKAFLPTARGGAIALDTARLVIQVLLAVGTINVVLAVFNMIPLPPLDGSAVIERLLPDRMLTQWFKFRQYSMGILLLVVLVLPDEYGFGRWVLTPAVQLWERLII